MDLFAARARSSKIAATALFSAPLRGMKTSHSSMLRRYLSPEFTGRRTKRQFAAAAPMAAVARRINALHAPIGFIMPTIERQAQLSSDRRVVLAPVSYDWLSVDKVPQNMLWKNKILENRLKS
ncbi:hypothetical protein N6L27_04135 [Leisingera sp. SS27]|uniref:hypothetical protein n=1 Tax=Leisingera sp. SS27 TaxID=2979462 RepID=UPI00232B7C7D|nr:hypothetical protein [Leisingera sp. SS27]MDC0657179.1 hypothetical protein [Leisingera sp. SS27]